MRYLFYNLIVLLLVSCTSIKVNDENIAGTFEGQLTGNKLIFSQDNFILLLPEYDQFTRNRGLDTLSYGKWNRNEKLLRLNSILQVKNKYLDVKGIESFSGSKDSIYIEIDNELSGLTFFDEKEIFEPDYFFSVNFSGNDAYNPHKLFSNSSIRLKRKGGIHQILLQIYPNLLIYPQQISFNVLYTYPYEVRDEVNNTFKIRIKNFDLRNFSYKIFDRELIEILNKDTLLWNDEKFVRMPDGK